MGITSAFVNAHPDGSCLAGLLLKLLSNDLGCLLIDWVRDRMSRGLGPKVEASH